MIVNTITLTNEEADLIMSALEEKRVEYGKFYKDAQKMGMIRFMQHWEDKAKLCRDLITKVYITIQQSGEVDRN